MKRLFPTIIITCLFNAYAFAQPMKLYFHDLPKGFVHTLESITPEKNMLIYESNVSYFPKLERYQVDSNVATKEYTKTKYIFYKDGTLYRKLYVCNKSSLPLELIMAIQDEAQGEKLIYVNKNVNQINNSVRFVAATAQTEIMLDGDYNLIKKSPRGQ